MASTLILIIVSIFDIIAFALAITAEFLRSTATVYTDYKTNYCVYTSDIATSYGVGAILFLMASQVLIMVATRCLCCRKPLSPSSSRTWSIVLFITSWLTFLAAEIWLIVGSVTNTKHTTYNTLFGEPLPNCEMSRKLIFATGAAFILFNGISTVIYYFYYSDATDVFRTDFGEDTGVVLGAYS